MVKKHEMWEVKCFKESGEWSSNMNLQKISEWRSWKLQVTQCCQTHVDPVVSSGKIHPSGTESVHAGTESVHAGSFNILVTSHYHVKWSIGVYPVSNNNNDTEREFLQSPHYTANCLHRMLWWPGCNCMQITCCTSGAYHMQHVMCHMVRQVISAITFDRVEILFILVLFHWLKPFNSKKKKGVAGGGGGGGGEGRRYGGTGELSENTWWQDSENDTC